jgi:hypothetical protein
MKAPMSKLVRKNLDVIAKAMHEGRRTVIIDGRIYELKEIPVALLMDAFMN